MGTKSMQNIATFIIGNLLLLNAAILSSQSLEKNPPSEIMQSDSMAFGPGEPNPSVDRYTGNLKRVITNSDNLVVLGFGVGMGLMFHPLDKEISNALAGKDNFLLATFPDKFGGAATVLSASALAYAVGRLTNNDHLANTGLLLLEATVTTQFITLAGKYLVQRPRPDGGNNHSFPSGHTSGMFAAASVLDGRYGYKVGIPSYLLASFVGFSRIRMEKHYPTDVVSGAILGIIVGRSFGKATPGQGLAVFPAIQSNSAGLAVRVNF